MSVSLDYASNSPVEQATRERILLDASKVAPPWGWWSESIIFFDAPGFSLAGSTSVFLLGYSLPDGSLREVDIWDDCFMAAMDSSFVLNQLRAWSKAHGIEWEVEIEGHSLGRIKRGRLSLRLLGQLFLVRVVVQLRRLAIRPTRLARSLASKYSDRWGESEAFSLQGPQNTAVEPTR